MSRPIPAQRPLAEPCDTKTRPTRRRARVAGIVAAALVISWGGPAAHAFWQTLSSNAGAATADSILAVPAPEASAAAGAASVSWAQGTTAAGRPVSGYTVARYPSAAGGTKVAAGGECAGTVTALTCSETALPAGTWHYTVTPVLASWAGAESARSGGVTAGDTTAPGAPTISVPTIINLANRSSVPVSGAAEAGSSVTITVTDSAAPQHTATQILSANDGGQWTAADFNLSAFNDGTITYTATAKDAAGNVSVAGSAQSIKDTVAPTVAAGGVVLANGTGAQFIPDAGDKLVVTFSEPLLPSSICGSWTATSGSQTVNGTVTLTGGNTLTFGTTDPGCPAIRFGSVTFNGNYSRGGTLTFTSTLTWDPAASQVTIILGSLTGGSPTPKNGNVLPTYTPSSGLTDAAGNPLPVSPVQGTNSRF